MSSDRTARDAGALRLVRIVDVRGAHDVARVEACLRGGVSALWLRDPAATGRELFEAALVLRGPTRARTSELWIGDRVDVAIACGADGVQLGRRAVPPERVRAWYGGRMGVSCHDAEELRAAEAAGADHVVVSPVFAVPDKGPSLGLSGLRALRARTRLPVVALGGIGASEVASVRGLGVAGVAVARALSEAADPRAVAQVLAGMTTP